MTTTRTAIAALIAARATTWSAAERARLEALVEALRPSPRHLADILDWIDDVAVRERIRPAAVLAEPALERILRARGSAPDRLKRWKEGLRRLRYPRLSAREAAFSAAVRALGLGPGVGIAPPPGLEGAAVTVTIEARSAADVARAAERLRMLVARGDLARLFALLDEA